jgi:thioredoxin reductase/ferredoxin
LFQSDFGAYLPFALVLVALWLAFGIGRRFRRRSAESRRQEAVEPGSTEPVSLHPVIDAKTCIGCGACTHACPEGKIIGLINGKAELLDPGACIGHGACKAACPVGAIELVFGTARRGVEIPLLSPTFESSTPGLYIAGELGGMGLVANAIEQGRQALEAIAQRDDLGRPGRYDVVIVGGGPAGIAASLAAKAHGLRFLTLEQDTLGGSVARYPRGKLVMTRPAELPIYGPLRFKRLRKERLIALWQKIVDETALEIQEGVRVERVTATEWGFEVKTTAGPTHASTVLLATGRRGSPRRLGVSGENLPKVVYSLDDPAQYRGMHVLVVGGGDSALECVIALSRHQLASLTLSYRGTTFDRACQANRKQFDEVLREGRVTFLRSSNVTAIEADRVHIHEPGRRHARRNDAVIACIGGVPPTALLADIGARFEMKYGAA